MIHLPLKQTNQAPDRLSVPGALRQIRRAVNTLDGEIYNHSYYPHDLVVRLLKAYSIHKLVLEQGDQPKCNYCESRCEKTATLQVEHYRPKAKVEAGENDHLTLPGYYWLGLEWTNLLLTCPKCNGKDAKGNKFPIRGIRANPVNPISNIGNLLVLDRTHCFAYDVPLSSELPILLNPEVDHPEDFLTFDVHAIIRGYGADIERGEVSKDLYMLNRDPLVAARLDVWAQFRNRTDLDIGGHMLGKLNDDGLSFNFQTTCREILQRKLPTEEFTLWGRYINNHIDEFVNHYVDAEYRDRFLEAYDSVVNEMQQLQVAI